MIYFDNSATNGFISESVIQSAIKCIRFSANPSRSMHKRANYIGEKILDARVSLADFFDFPYPERVIFTKNTTESLNLAILGLDLNGKNVITSVFEHNSILRPLIKLRDKNAISLSIIAPQNGEFVTDSDIAKNIRDNTSLVILSHANNTTGSEIDINKIGRFLKSKKITFAVDGAQSCGHIPISMEKDSVSLLAVPFHKGLGGLTGGGALLVGNDVSLSPIIYGGTGNGKIEQENVFPDSFEAGTLNIPAICSVTDAINSLKITFENDAKKLQNLLSFLYRKKWNDNVKVYSKMNRVGIFSFNVKNKSPQEVAYILSEKYDIGIRSGMCCAPLSCKFIGATDGICRASLSHFNTEREVEHFIKAICEIAQ